jgi:signal transduction histidine kinase
MESVEILSHVIELSNSNLDIGERLLAILSYLSESFKVDASSLFAYQSESETLSFHSSDRPADDISSKISYSLGEGIVGICAKKREPIILMDCTSLGGDASNQIKDMCSWGAMLAQPVADADFFYGVLLLQNRKPLVFADEEIRLISVVAREMAGSIRNARLYFDAKKRLSELSALFEISKAVNSTSDLDRLIDLIVKTSVQIIGARGGVLRLADEGNQTLITRSSYGWYPQSREKLSLKDKDNNVCQVIRTGSSMLVKNTNDEFACSDLIREQVHSYICVPLWSKKRLLGVLSVFDKETIGIGFKGSFVEGDLDLLTAMAGYISSALEKVTAFKEVENLVKEKDVIVRELSILHGTSMALIGARRLERVLRILLSAITLGNGLGFNRAMLFLINENNRTLDGRVAVGPENQEDAARIWQALSKDKRSLNEWLMSEDLDRNGFSKLDETVRRIRIPLDDEGNILNKCIQKRDVLNIKRGGLRYGADFSTKIEVAEAFAVVPIISKGKVLGAVLVDNIFNRMEISENDIRFLLTFVSQAGIAIENSVLYQNLQDAHDELRRMQGKLIHSERLAALGEFSASIAHELRNPLVSIGGYARRLEKEVHNRYVEIIIKEVGRLEDLLNKVLTFSKVGKGRFEETDLNHILEDCLFGLSEVAKAQKIEVFMDLSNDNTLITCDPDQMKQAFLNLLTNAIQAMKNGGTLTVKTSLFYDTEETFVVAEVADTGGGIAPEILHNIFNPFFTTKDFGTGLGLSITHRIVSNHDGSIEVKNLPASGCSFVVKIPLKG